MSDSSDPSFLTSFQNKLVLQEEEEESSSGKVKKEDADWGKFHGVRKRPRGDFVAEIRNPDIHVWLGAYESPEEAAFAYDQGAYKLYGSRALLNFPYLIGAYSKPNGHIRSQISPIV